MILFKKFFSILFITIVFGAFSNFILIHHYALFGIAVVTLIAFTIGYLYFIQKLIHIKRKSVCQ